MASALPQCGGVLLQAEDELASINMIIGASYGGKPALTATAGPGLSLMIESLGLAVAAEVPCCHRCGAIAGPGRPLNGHAQPLVSLREIHAKV